MAESYSKRINDLSVIDDNATEGEYHEKIKLMKILHDEIFKITPSSGVTGAFSKFKGTAINADKIGELQLECVNYKNDKLSNFYFRFLIFSINYKFIENINA